MVDFFNLKYYNNIVKQRKGGYLNETNERCGVIIRKSF